MILRNERLNGRLDLQKRRGFNYMLNILRGGMRKRRRREKGSEGSEGSEGRDEKRRRYIHTYNITYDNVKHVTLADDRTDVESVSFSSDHIVSASKNGVKLWGLDDSGQWVLETEKTAETKYNGVVIRTRINEKTGEMKDAFVPGVWISENEKWVLETKFDSPVSVSFSPDGKSILATGGHGIYVWNVDTGKTTLFAPNVSLSGSSSRTTKTIHSVTSAAFSPDGTLVVSGSKTSEEHYIKIWSVETGKVRSSVQVKNHLPGSTVSEIISVSFSPNGGDIVSGSRDGTMRLYDAQRMSFKMSTKLHDDLTSMSFSPADETKIVSSGGRSDPVILWSNMTNMGGRELQRFEVSDVTGGSVSFSTDGAFVVVGGHSLEIWRVTDGVRVATLKGSKYRFMDSKASFSPNGKNIVSGSEDGIIKVWDVSFLDDLRHYAMTNSTIIAEWLRWRNFGNDTNGRVILTKINAIENGDYKVTIFKGPHTVIEFLVNEFAHIKTYTLKNVSLNVVKGEVDKHKDGYFHVRLEEEEEEVFIRADGTVWQEQEKKTADEKEKVIEMEQVDNVSIYNNELVDITVNFGSNVRNLLKQSILHFIYIYVKMDGVSKKATVTWVPDQQLVEKRENMKISQLLLDENFRV